MDVAGGLRCAAGHNYLEISSEHPALTAIPNSRPATTQCQCRRHTNASFQNWRLLSLARCKASYFGGLGCWDLFAARAFKYSTVSGLLLPDRVATRLSIAIPNSVT